LKSDSQCIRAVISSDAEAIINIYRYYVESTAVSFEEKVPTLTQMIERIESTTKHYPWLVYLQDEQITGYAYASKFRSRSAYRWTAEVTIYVADKVKRSGSASKLYTALLDSLVEQNFKSAIAVVTEPNPESEKFHQKMGFRKIGTFTSIGYKLNQWHDTGWWQKML